MNNEIINELKQGGAWLRQARIWMQSNIKDGDRLHWSSGQDVSVPFYKLEEFAMYVAAAAIESERKRTGVR